MQHFFSKTFILYIMIKNIIARQMAPFLQKVETVQKILVIYIQQTKTLTLLSQLNTPGTGSIAEQLNTTINNLTSALAQINGNLDKDKFKNLLHLYVKTNIDMHVQQSTELLNDANSYIEEISNTLSTSITSGF